ncbi:MAG: transglycosylase SLT domain-containing protein [Gemmatimonas sp.]|nr:transglycosylase SLT domain-containing protein [Gemmatimonas sp.]
MEACRRRRTPPCERACSYPRHSTGRTRRRWPRAYDGGLPPELAVSRRYRRAYDGDLKVERRRTSGSRRSLDALRQGPVRDGLIGLALVGAAAPIAVSRYQEVLRADPSHEAALAHGVTAFAATDADVTEAWEDLEEAEQDGRDDREGTIEESLQRYSDFGLGRELAESIYDMATANQIEPEIAFGLVRAESSFKNSSTSEVGAVGLTQLMPKTAGGVEPYVTRSQLRDPETNLRIGFSYLRQLIDKYDDTDLALTAYNRGPGTVDRELQNGGNPDNGYAGFVRGEEGHGHTLYTD